MKKNVLMGVFALLFAAGTAFATTTKVIQPVYYWDNEITKNSCLELNLKFECEPGVQSCQSDDNPTGLMRQLYGSEDCETVTLQPESGF